MGACNSSSTARRAGSAAARLTCHCADVAGQPAPQSVSVCQHVEVHSLPPLISSYLALLEPQYTPCNILACTASPKAGLRQQQYTPRSNPGHSLWTHPNPNAPAIPHSAQHSPNTWTRSCKATQDSIDLLRRLPAAPTTQASPLLLPAGGRACAHMRQQAAGH